MSCLLENDSSSRARVTHFLEEIRIQAGVGYGAEVERVLAAFGAVPREAHAGPGPWTLRSPRYGQASTETPDADVSRLYHNALVSLDRDRNINIGEPAFWLRTLLKAQVQAGERVLQAGAGSGYYTAILSRLVGEAGFVLAFEIDERLSVIATSALAGVPNVTIRGRSALQEPLAADAPVSLILAFAGVSILPMAWIARLTTDGRIFVPMTGSRGWGAMVEIRRNTRGFSATTRGACGFIPCLGARDPVAETMIDQALQDSTRLDGWTFELTQDGKFRT
jgi:protein-L-isoaspartate(D-aspartate) O-methyltransferase